MNDNNSSSSSPRVIVIGAGVSGLACARELKQRRHDVLVLEARRRVGGRLKGMELGGTHVDLGGALIHGIINNPVYSLVNQMNITITPVSSTLLMDSDGLAVQAERDERVTALFNSLLEETFSKSQQGKHGNFGTLFDSLARADLEKLSERDQELFQWHKENLEVSCGASFSKLGYRWNDDEPYGYDGQHVKVDSSWATVMEKLQEGLNIRYNAQVREVKIVTTETKPTTTTNGHHISNIQSSSRLRRSSRSTKGVAGTRFSESPSKEKPKTVVLVSLQNGSTLQADSVVCTLPLGVLKLPPEQGGVVFDPPLPLPKRAAIEKLGCGLLNKCALLFPQVFWQEDDFIGVVATNRFHLVVNHNHPHPVLVFWFGGSFAATVQDWTDEEIVQDCLAVLETATGRVPPDPLDYAVTRWGHEEHSRGAFVYVPPGVDSKELAEMSQPIFRDDRPVLLFAGEHTTPFHPSTIHGAYLSGIREAYRLDLAVAPALNNYLTFNDEAMYKRTFSCKKKTDDNNAKTTALPQKLHPSSFSPVRPKKKKRESGDMLLRKRPRTTAFSYSSTPSSKRQQNGVAAHLTTRRAVPSRRSHRSTAGKRLQDPLFDPNVTSANDTANSSSSSQHNQDDMTLLRAVESYGKTSDGWNLIQTKILPDYTLTQLKARHKKLTAKQKPPTGVDWTNWLVPKATDEKPRTQGSRKSKRGNVPRVVLDV